MSTILESGDARSARDSVLSATDLTSALADLPGWVVSGRCIQRTWTFADHFHAMAFVNAVAWISHQQDHHPDMQAGYNTVTVSYSTHSSGGVSEKDLICAAKVSQLGEG